MQPLVFEHFSSNYHNDFLEDCSIPLIDKTVGLIPLEDRNIGGEF